MRYLRSILLRGACRASIVLAMQRLIILNVEDESYHVDCLRELRCCLWTEGIPRKGNTGKWVVLSDRQRPLGRTPEDSACSQSSLHPPKNRTSEQNS